MTADAIERAARESYGRLLALLAARTRDLAAAEDALADAFAAALEAWPRVGVPDNPDAWLLTAARRRLTDRARRRATAQAAEPALALIAEETALHRPDATDPRLALMFACAHPVVDQAARTPLILQTLLGFSAERIAAAFLVEPAAMGQRLVRAKRRLKEAGAAFEVPDVTVWPERLDAVLEAIYAAYAEGWTDPTGADPRRRELAEEAVWLARITAEALPRAAEALGLVALLLHLEARRPARRDANGRYVPLTEQDPALWRTALIAEAEAALKRAAALRRTGRFQLEAAVQSVHAARARTGRVDWAALTALYEALARETGSPVARLNACAAALPLHGAASVLNRLEAAAAEAPTLQTYQPYHALRAHLLAETGDAAAARVAYAEALAREPDPAVRAYLADRLAALGDPR